MCVIVNVSASNFNVQISPNLCEQYINSVKHSHTCIKVQLPHISFYKHIFLHLDNLFFYNDRKLY